MDKSILRVEHFDGFFKCRSTFVGDVRSTCYDFSYSFEKGVYILSGEIDSGGWAFSSSLCPSKKKYDAILDERTKFKYLDKEVCLSELRKNVCNLQVREIPFFKKFEPTVSEIINKNIKKNNLDITVEELKDMFGLCDDRFDRPVFKCGNEGYRSLAAIGVTENKTIFCLPWLSSIGAKYFCANFTGICEALSSLGKLVLLPCDDRVDAFNQYNKITFPKYPKKD